jgi:hypothetical protein
LQLFDSERQPMVVTVDVQNHSFDALPFFRTSEGCLMRRGEMSET